MKNFYYYFISCGLLLLSRNWRTSSGLPLRSESSRALCAAQFHHLLNVTDVGQSRFLCDHPNKESIVWSADTVEACAPTVTQSPGCVTQRSTPFNENECLNNIMKDLAHYDAAINSYLKLDLKNHMEETELLRPALGTILYLRENCSLTGGETNLSKVDAVPMWTGNSFKDRQTMCKMMKGFHVRAITINRALGYISAGDHRE